MANYTYTNNGITFSLPSFDPASMAKFTKKYMYANNYAHASEGVEPFINAVEIDWNGAQLATTINQSW